MNVLGVFSVICHGSFSLSNPLFLPSHLIKMFDQAGISVTVQKSLSLSFLCHPSRSRSCSCRPYLVTSCLSFFCSLSGPKIHVKFFSYHWLLKNERWIDISFFFILTDLWFKQKPIFWPMVSYRNLNLDFCLAPQFCRANVLSIDIQTMAIKTQVSILFSQWYLFFISDHKNVEQCKWGRHIQLCTTCPV